VHERKPRAVGELDLGSIDEVSLISMFHAHLIQTELVSADMRGEVHIPRWIMHEVGPCRLSVYPPVLKAPMA